MSKRVEALIECDRVAMLAEYERDRAIPHQGTKGGAREAILIKFLQKHVPARYGVDTGHLISADDSWSKQQDVIIYDRLNSPLLEDLGSSGKIVFVESAIGVIEVKSSMALPEIDDMNEKAKSVHSLLHGRRFFKPEGVQSSHFPEILCLGFAFESPADIQSIGQRLQSRESGCLDMLCLLKDRNGKAGFFITHRPSGIQVFPGIEGESGTAALRRFLFEILSHLQKSSSLIHAPDLHEYLDVFGLDQLRRLQALNNQLWKSEISDDEIIEMMYLMGQVPGLTRDLILADTSVFMFERSIEGDTMIVEVWTFNDESGTLVPLPTKLAHEAARKHHLGGSISQIDWAVISALLHWFRRMRNNNEKLIIKSP